MYNFYLKKYLHPPYGREHLRKLLLIMKLTTFILITTILHVSAVTLAQKVTLKAKNVPLINIFDQISTQTGYDFAFTTDILKNSKSVTINVSNKELSTVLTEIFQGQDLEFSLDNKTVVVKLKKVSLFDKIENAFAAIYITGKVTDEHDNPLPGITIRVKGTNLVFRTNQNGMFTVVVDKPDAVLQFTSIGFLTQEIPADQIKNLAAIVMKEDIGKLDELQVIAYGTTTKRLNTGSVTTVTAADIAKNPVHNILEALQGHVPGLSIIQNSGQAGGSFNINIRGAANLAMVQANIPPLILVDGVAIPSGSLPLTGTSDNTKSFIENFTQGGSALNFLNPNDVESVEILKDADATAIYGAKAAYGVILITTKKAKPGPPSLNINVYTGASVIGSTEKFLNISQYLALRREAIANNGDQISPYFDLDLTAYDQNRNVNWTKEFLGKYAENTSSNLSYSGGNQYSSFLLSGGFNKQGDIQFHQGSVGSGNVNFSLSSRTANNKLSVTMNGGYMVSNNTDVPFQLGTAGIPPNYPDPRLPDGSLDWSSGSNILAPYLNQIFKSTSKSLRSSLTLQYNPIRKLTLRTQVGYTDLQSDELNASPTTVFAPGTVGVASLTQSAVFHTDINEITVTPYAEFSTGAGKKGDLNIKAGGEITGGTSTQNKIQGTGFASDALLYDPAVAGTVIGVYAKNESRNASYFAVIKYVWDNKYIVDFNGRREGSTKFGPDKRFGNFGSVGAAWLFNEEKWVRENLPFISFGKLRASTGLTGGSNIGEYLWLSTYTSTLGYGGNPGLSTNQVPNPDLHWERSTRNDLALELGLFNERIYFEANYYINKNSDQLIGQPISSVTGFTQYATNTNSVINSSGWELALNTTNVKSKNFSWSTNFNISIPHTKLISLANSQLGVVSPNYIVGKPVTGILLYKYDGVNPETGNRNFTAKSGIVTETGLDPNVDKTEFLDLAPKFEGGISNTFNYKQFSLDVFLRFTKKTGENILAQYSISPGYSGINPPIQWLNRWEKPGDITNIPRVYANFLTIVSQNLFNQSGGAYSDASFIRLQNVNLRYNISQKLLSKYHIKGLNVFLQGQNLYTFSKYNGLDPENLNPAVLPMLRTIAVGLNVTL